MELFSKIFSSPSLRAKQERVETQEPKPTSSSVAPYDELKQRGNQFLSQGNFEAAVQSYEMALEAHPHSSEAHVNLGYALTELLRIEEAKIHFAQAAKLHPDNFDAHLLHAMLSIAESDVDAALESIQRALKIQPKSPVAKSVLFKTYAIREEFSNIEACLREENRQNTGSADLLYATALEISRIQCDAALKKTFLIKAIDYLVRASDLKPDFFEAISEQGRIYFALDEFDMALKCFQIAIGINSSYVNAHYGLAITYQRLDNIPAAVANIEKSIFLDPKFLDAYKLLGEIKSQQGDRDAAIINYRKVIELEPDSPDAFIMLGCLHTDQGKLEQALKLTQKAVDLRKNSPEVYFALGNVFSAQGNFREAADRFQHALNLRPDYVDARNNMASALLAMGRNAEALGHYRAVVAAQPNHLIALQNVAFCLSFDGDCSPITYLKCARQFGAAASALAKPYTSWVQAPLEERPLKVGFVSADLRQHPVGFFLESVLTYLDLEKIEIHAYSNRTTNDALQLSLKSRVSSWTAIEGLNDEAAAELIHDAQLDLLIDLSGHTGMNRLGIFPWRPAPVQATWLGYWASTGVAEIDYVLADRHAVLPEHHDHFSEQVWYLEDTRLCFTPRSNIYELVPSKPPSVKNKYITFGCFQSIKKLNPAVLALWGRIHQQLPDAKFRLQGTGFTDPKISADLLQRLADVGIASSCVSLHGSVAGYDYLKAHAHVDIILDCFPFPGGTTTCDALWMGVPTVTLAGNTMLSRQGTSLLSYAGLQDWIAESQDEYVSTAVEKARNKVSLVALRASLRLQVFKSPLFDAPGFASRLQDSLRSMVQRHSHSP